jgi:hypothetical protein
MATTVRINRPANRKLDELQARLFLLTRRKLSKQDILDLIVEVGPDIDRLALRVSGIKLPLPERIRRRIRRRAADWGVETREEDIDRTLYG